MNKGAASGIMEALWGWPPPVLDPAGPYASSVTTLAWALFAMGVLVTGIVIAALYVAIKGPERWREKLGGEKAVWIGGIAFPAVVLTGLLIWGLALTASLTEPITGREARVRVTGELWWFRVEYLDPAGRVIVRDANELHLPLDRPVVLELRSADVVHSLWIPHLSGKMDMVPGRINRLRVEASRTGRFGGVCAEYCGGPHALMGFVTQVHEAADYDRWLAAHAARQAESVSPGMVPGAPADVPRDPAAPQRYDPARGWALFRDTGCAACHRIAGTEANGLAGPDLTHVGSRLSLGAGILPNHRGTMIGWIADSQSIKPGNRMPSYDRLSAEELGHIAAFLEAQK